MKASEKRVMDEVDTLKGAIEHNGYSYFVFNINSQDDSAPSNLSATKLL